MSGNRDLSKSLHYAIRITFGIVHGVILTVLSLALAMWFPSLSHFMFGLFGFIVAPVCSLALTFLCNVCVSYVSSFRLDVRKSLSTIWIPPLGILLTATVLLPLEMMPSFAAGPLNTLAATFVATNCILATLLQIYASRVSSSSDSEAEAVGGAAPK